MINVSLFDTYEYIVLMVLGGTFDNQVGELKHTPDVFHQDYNRFIHVFLCCYGYIYGN